jgi:hypothetical protein
VILKNTAIPTKMEDYYTTVDDNQTSALISIYEGEKARVVDCCVVTCFHKSFGGPPKFVVLCLFLPHAYISLFSKGLLESFDKMGC